MTNVAKFPATAMPKPRAVSRAKRKAMNYQLMTASAIGLCATTVTALSLNHLATGIETITHCPAWQGWAMAMAVDCGFVSLELSQLTISDKLRTKLASYFRPAVIGTLAWSAALNALAFAGDASGLPGQVMGVALGLSIPALIYVLTKIGAGMYLDCQR